MQEKIIRKKITTQTYWDNYLPIDGSLRKELAKDFLGQNKCYAALPIVAPSNVAPRSAMFPSILASLLSRSVRNPLTGFNKSV